MTRSSPPYWAACPFTRTALLGEEGGSALSYAEATPLADLPDPDKQVFRYGLPPEAPMENGVFSSGFAYYFEDGIAPESSRFVGDEPTYVQYENTFFVVRFDGTGERVRRTFEYESSVVARNTNEFQAVVEEVFIIDVTTLDLPREARTLLEHVLSCGHYKETPRYSREVLTLLEAFERQPTKPLVNWKYYLWHESTYYELAFQRH